MSLLGIMKAEKSAKVKANVLRIDYKPWKRLKGMLIDSMGADKSEFRTERLNSCYTLNKDNVYEFERAMKSNTLGNKLRQMYGTSVQFREEFIKEYGTVYRFYGRHECSVRDDREIAYKKMLVHRYKIDPQLVEEFETWGLMLSFDVIYDKEYQIVKDLCALNIALTFMKTETKITAVLQGIENIDNEMEDLRVTVGNAVTCILEEYYEQNYHKPFKERNTKWIQ